MNLYPSGRVRLSDISDWEKTELKKIWYDHQVGGITIDAVSDVTETRLHTGYYKDNLGPYAKVSVKNVGCLISVHKQGAIERIGSYIDSWPVRNRVLIVTEEIPPFVLDMFQDKNYMIHNCHIDLGVLPYTRRLCKALSFPEFEDEHLLPILVTLATT